MSKNQQRSTRAKWVFAILAMFLFAIWIVSGWVQITPIGYWRVAGTEERLTTAGLSGGCLYYFRAALPAGTLAGKPALLAPFSLHSAKWYWLPKHTAGGTNFCFVSLPLWILLVPIGLLAIWTWRRDTIAQRATNGQCLSCGYDRAGLASGARCPECGEGGGAGGTAGSPASSA